MHNAISDMASNEFIYNNNSSTQLTKPQLIWFSLLVIQILNSKMSGVVHILDIILTTHS